MSERLGLWLFAAVLALAMLARPLWERGAGDGVLVEVVGDVPIAGTHRLAAPTLAAAIEAAGGDARGIPAVPVGEGQRVEVGPNGIRVGFAGDMLRFGRAFDVDHADAAGFAAIPGIGAATAARIVADREAHGPFGGVAALRRVPGLSRSMIARIAAVGPMEGAPAVDVNRASLAELDDLPGIGPVIAARIVEDRTANGSYATVDDLTRVAGLSPSTVRGLASRAAVR